MRILRRVSRTITALLASYGIMDRHRVTPTAELVGPRVVTGFARRSVRTADLIMVGWVLGAPGIAGLAFAYAYSHIGTQLSLGLAGGTISLVAQNFGGEAHERAELAIKMSVWIATVLALPLMIAFAVFPVQLIELLGAGPETVSHGADYLRIISIAVLFSFFNKIGSRSFAGVGDTFTPMVIRVVGAALNITLNAVFILGMGLGVAGAALGTAVATGAVTLGLAWGFFGRSYPAGETPPLRFRVRGPHWDTDLARQLVEIASPLLLRNLATSIVVFPLLAIGAVFGTVAVAALEVGRQVRGLMNCLSWGFSMAASTLVGQQLGAGDETEAEAYGWDILRVSGLAYLALSVVVVAFAGPIASAFVSEPDAHSLATVFVVVGAVSAVGLGVEASAHGALRGGGDTRWPFYGRLVGYYAIAVPVAFVGTVTPLGIVGLYLALVLETFVPAIVNVYRFHSNAWKSISRAYRPRTAD